MKKVSGMLVTLIIMGGCTVQPAVHGPVVGNSHGNFYHPAVQQNTTADHQFSSHTLTSHGGES
jgi:hypothetical protein